MIRWTLLLRSTLWALLAVFGFVLAAASVGAAEPVKPLAERIQAGPLKVIVKLRTDIPGLPVVDAAGIAASQERLAQRLANRGHSPSGWHAYRSLPAVAMEADAGLHATLTTDPEVESVEEDRLASPSWSGDARPTVYFGNISLYIVDAGVLSVLGRVGEGMAVAILDTGVDRAHPFLGGRVVAEACFSTTLAAARATSLCPSGASSQIGTGAAAPCTGLAACFQGTHSAGTVAGYQSESVAGIAQRASIIAVQVFSRIDDASLCGTAGSCLRSFASDQLRGLDHVLGLRSAHTIAAVNMGLGGTAYGSQASCDAANLASKHAIDLLRSTGIATVIASGEGGHGTKISEPACISSAISVTGTNNGVYKVDSANIADFVTITAHGHGVTSSVPGGVFQASSGSATAAAAVAGAVAVMREGNPTGSIDDMIPALGAHPDPFRWNEKAYPKLMVRHAVAAFCPSCMSAYTGWWWNPSEPGRGFSIETRQGYAFVGAYLYEEDGSPLWLVGKGRRQVSVLSELFLARFANGQTLTSAHRDPSPATVKGSATLTFSSPTSGTLTWPGGAVPIQRFPIDGQSVVPPPSDAPETGWWWDPNAQGTGWYSEVQGSNIFLVGYLYESDGRPVWYVSSGPMLSSTAFDGDLQLYGGGQTMLGTYRQPDSSESIGRISLRFSSRTTGTLTLPQGRVVPLSRYTIRP